MTRLQLLVTRAKTTQQTMAKTLGVSRQYLNALIGGKRLPSPVVAYALARLVNADPGDIWELTEVGIVARNADDRRRKPAVRRTV